MLDAKENLEDYSSCDITATTSVDKNHDTFDESAILAGKIFLKRFSFQNIFLQIIFFQTRKTRTKFLRFLQGRPEKRKNGLTTF